MSVVRKFTDVRFLKSFAGWNVWFWLANLIVINVMYFAAHNMYSSIAILYLVNVSIISLILGGLSWWQSARVEDKQDNVTSQNGDENY